jgi:hypothetical protein
MLCVPGCADPRMFAKPFESEWNVVAAVLQRLQKLLEDVRKRPNPNLLEPELFRSPESTPEQRLPQQPVRPEKKPQIILCKTYKIKF